MKLSETVKGIFDKYVIKMQNGEQLHRYQLEEDMEKHNKIYTNPQRVELLLKDAAIKNLQYSKLFDKLYGDMVKYNSGDFRL